MPLNTEKLGKRETAAYRASQFSLSKQREHEGKPTNDTRLQGLEITQETQTHRTELLAILAKFEPKSAWVIVNLTTYIEAQPPYEQAELWKQLVAEPTIQAHLERYWKIYQPYQDICDQLRTFVQSANNLDENDYLSDKCIKQLGKIDDQLSELIESISNVPGSDASVVRKLIDYINSILINSGSDTDSEKKRYASAMAAQQSGFDTILFISNNILKEKQNRYVLGSDFHKVPMYEMVSLIHDLFNQINKKVPTPPE